MTRLRIIPLRIKEANRVVQRLHRKLKPVQGGLCAIGVCVDGADEPCGAAILGRPQARMSDDIIAGLWLTLGVERMAR